MVFCNSVTYSEKKQLEYSHNPYFNRWFSAIWDYGDLSFIAEDVTILILIDGFLQYEEVLDSEYGVYVTILILIDGFLQ